MIYLILSFFLTAFGQPAWIPGLGILSAAFGFALFWKGMLAFPKPRDRFLLALIWFAAVQGVQLSWLATFDYMGPFILVLYFVLIGGMGIQFGMISLLIRETISWPRALAISGSWVIFEWMRLYFLCGFTWNPTGLALTDSPYSLQFASVWGIFGLSFWVILVNIAALKAWLAHSTRLAAVWVSLAFFPYLFGVVNQYWVESSYPTTGALDVALIHTNLSPEEKEYLEEAAAAYIPPLVQWEQIVSALQDRKVDLIVMPEVVLPLGAHTPCYRLESINRHLDEDAFPPLKRPFAIFDRGYWKVNNVFLLQALANQSNAHVIAGLDDRDVSGKYNAAFHFNPKNIQYERYEKQILVPVGEYVPLKYWERISRFIGDQFGIYSSFDPGLDGKVFRAQVPIGVSICLEETFTGVIRNLRLKGAQVLVNLTNDAWFPNSKLPQQHFDHGRVRAAENGVPILRACNSGITGAIDCFGRTIATLPVTQKRASALHFSFPVRSYPTLYTWWGDSAILGISLSAVVSYFIFRKKKLP
jgi:apolipoprotein N-acyltransferase